MRPALKTINPPASNLTGKFTFKADTAIYEVDMLFVSYRNRTGQTTTETFVGKADWQSPDFDFKSGDSIRVDAFATGTIKKDADGSTIGVAFMFNPSLTILGLNNGGSSMHTPIVASKFRHKSSLYYAFK